MAKQYQNRQQISIHHRHSRERNSKHWQTSYDIICTVALRQVQKDRAMEWEERRNARFQCFCQLFVLMTCVINHEWINHELNVLSRTP